MSSQFVTFIGWSIVPGLATNIVQTVFYGLTIRAGDPKPAPGSPAFVKHYRRIRISLIILYLLYTVYEASQILQRRGDFYQLLGVEHKMDDKGIKSRFRRLAAMHHPDKVAAAGRQPVTEDYFVQLKLAQDTLLEPVKRFAYDRFGPDMLAWQHCSTVTDYLSTGFKAYAPTYIGSGIGIIVLTAAGWLQWGKFWRYFAIGGLLTLELYTVTRPYEPAILAKLINPLITGWSSHPPLLQFQFLSLARTLLFTSFIGMSQLAPLLQSTDHSLPPNEVDPRQLARLEQLAQAQEMESTRLVAMGMLPFRESRGLASELQDSIRDWLVQNTTRADPLVREAVEESIRRGPRRAPDVAAELDFPM